MKLFTDGGTVKKNPSLLGGTWAWCLVSGDEVVTSACGVVGPFDLGSNLVTNNDTEAFAAIRGLQFMWDKFQGEWTGEWWTDSKVTLHRLSTSDPLNLPAWARRRIMSLRKKRTWTTVLCAGHATKRELEQGFRERNKLPTSVWNNYVDEMCQQAAWDFLGGGVK